MSVVVVVYKNAVKMLKSNGDALLTETSLFFFVYDSMRPEPFRVFLMKAPST
jgi:hypothetical protein